MIITPAFISCVKPAVTYSDDARLASSKVTRHHGLQVQEQMAGVGWREMDRLIAFGHMSPDNKELKFKRPGLRGSGQHMTYTFLHSP